uniref:AsIV-cont00013-ORF1 n=1 Tax=Apophua simplicipes ichnovirus TaxID=1329648 RepID=S5DMG3_9VIRU|nr:AsIV-cont00013-ORF1 [Apophua simplicipes ichnovirus]
MDPRGNESNEIDRMIRTIKGYNEYLSKFKARDDLDDLRREDLVQCQKEKEIMVGRLKMAVRNMNHVPQSVLEIYF